jgi:hypothetical protein
MEHSQCLVLGGLVVRLSEANTHPGVMLLHQILQHIALLMHHVSLDRCGEPRNVAHGPQEHLPRSKRSRCYAISNVWNYFVLFTYIDMRSNLVVASLLHMCYRVRHTLTTSYWSRRSGESK